MRDIFSLDSNNKFAELLRDVRTFAKELQISRIRRWKRPEKNLQKKLEKLQNSCELAAEKVQKPKRDLRKRLQKLQKSCKRSWKSCKLSSKEVRIAAKELQISFRNGAKYLWRICKELRKIKKLQIIFKKSANSCKEVAN